MYIIGKYKIHDWSLDFDENFLRIEDSETSKFKGEIRVFQSDSDYDPDYGKWFIWFFSDSFINEYKEMFPDSSGFNSREEAKERVDYFLLKLSKLKSFI